MDFGFEAQAAFDFRPVEHALRAPASCKRLVAHDRHSPQRAQLEGFVRGEFAAHFAADVREFMPLLLALQDGAQRVHAVVGCRAAANERLFLERYTRLPIERMIAQRIGVIVDRERIAEIGSLACRGGRDAVQMIAALVPYLMGAGFDWVAFTGADTVKRVFRRMHLYPTALCRADRALLGGDAASWGRYYEFDPEVMVGRLRDGTAVAGDGLRR